MTSFITSSNVKQRRFCKIQKHVHQKTGSNAFLKSKQKIRFVLFTWISCYNRTGYLMYKNKDVGKDAIGKNVIGKNAKGKNAIGKNAIGKNVIGKNAIGKNVIGKNAKGKNAIGKNAIGKNAIGKNAICGVLLSFKRTNNVKQ